MTSLTSNNTARVLICAFFVIITGLLVAGIVQNETKKIEQIRNFQKSIK
jgi:hypothetical protein